LRIVAGPVGPNVPPAAGPRRMLFKRDRTISMLSLPGSEQRQPVAAETERSPITDWLKRLARTDGPRVCPKTAPTGKEVLLSDRRLSQGGSRSAPGGAQGQPFGFMASFRFSVASGSGDAPQLSKVGAPFDRTIKWQRGRCTCACFWAKSRTSPVVTAFNLRDGFFQRGTLGPDLDQTAPVRSGTV